METLRGIPEAGLADTLADLVQTKMIVLSLTKSDGAYTVVYTPSSPSIDTERLDQALPSSPPVANMDDPSPAPAGAPGEFVHARSIAPKTILYTDADGRDEIREGGSRSWRNSNPGNIRKGDFSRNCGAIGDDGSFAIFPDETVGKAAIIALMKTAAYIRLT